MKTTIADIKKTKKILSQDPGPLYSDAHKIALFFSAKSGCTFAVKWFFFQTGFLEVAKFYSDWIHDFRINVFYESFGYKRSLHKVTNDDTKIIKVVRNPYSRAVSSYLHAIRYGYADIGLSAFFGRDIDRNHGLSFREYISYLEKVNLRKCNVHHRLQIHPAEIRGIVKPNYIVKLENSFEDFNKIEEELNLKSSSSINLRVSKHDTNRQEEFIFCGDKKFFRNQENPNFPTSKNFYDQELSERVLQLYKIDFEQYNYDTNMIP